MPFFIAQNVLNGGELSPELAARWDQPRYQTGSSIMRNIVPLPQGGVTKRPGMIYCGPAKDQESDPDRVRLAPFIFSATQSRVLEFGPRYVRIWLPDGSLVTRNGAPYEVSTPYAAGEIAGLSFAQSADVLFIASRGHPPAKLSRYADDDWRFAAINWLPTTPTPTIARVYTLGGKGDIPYRYVVTAVDGTTGQESLPSDPAYCEGPFLSQECYNLIEVNPVPGAGEYRVYKKKGGIYGFIGRITGSDTSFEDRNIGADGEDTPPMAKNPFDGPDTYPGLVFLHQQRLGFASSRGRPLTVWLSRTAAFESMAASVPPKDDDAIEVTLAANQANRIVWACSDRSSLALGTEGGEWLLSAPENGVFSPANLAFQPQTFNGSVPDLAAIQAGSGILYVQRGGGVVREFGYSFQADRYESPDLTLLARHILRNRSIRAWAWQQEPHAVVWAALSDGTLAAMTYMRGQDVVGWHRHDTDGVVESVACVPGTPDDALWLTVRRESVAPDGTRIARRHVERLADFFVGPDLREAFFVDGGLSRKGEPAAAFSGLGHLEGREVAVFCDGYVHPPRVVRNGAITLERPARAVCVGLPYEGELVPLPPETNLQDGSSLGRPRKIAALKCRTWRSMTFNAALEAPGVPAAFHPVRGGRGSLTPWYGTDAEDLHIPLAGGWEQRGRVRLLMPDPVPVTILALISSVELAEWP